MPGNSSQMLIGPRHLQVLKWLIELDRVVTLEKPPLRPMTSDWLGFIVFLLLDFIQIYGDIW